MEMSTLKSLSPCIQHTAECGGHHPVTCGSVHLELVIACRFTLLLIASLKGVTISLCLSC